MFAPLLQVLRLLWPHSPLRPSRPLAGQGIWSAAVTLPGTDLRVSVLQAMVWALIPPAIAMVSSNIRRVWASRPEDLPEEERGLKTVRTVGERISAVSRGATE